MSPLPRWRFVETETGKGHDALERRPKLKAALQEARHRGGPLSSPSTPSGVMLAPCSHVGFGDRTARPAPRSPTGTISRALPRYCCRVLPARR
jgi:hypothetical protein